MEILCLSRRIDYLNNTYFSFIIKFVDYQDIWLINCGQGLQNILIDHKIKMNQISKIFLTNLYYDNISGLLGILSSLNLMKRIQPLYIYTPNGLQFYLDLCKKYSRTNFTYIVYINLLDINSKLVTNYIFHKVYVLFHNYQYQLCIMSIEKSCKFILNQAQHLNLSPGPLYGKLKKNFVFILPDGVILKGITFIDYMDKGQKLCLLFNKYHTRLAIENSLNSIIFAI